MVASLVQPFRWHGRFSVMLAAVIQALILLVCIAIAVYLIIWVLGEIGIAIPGNIMRLIWVLLILVALLYLLSIFGPRLHIADYSTKSLGNGNRVFAAIEANTP
jgi:hypothetical protein